MWWNIGFPATTLIIFIGLLHLKKGQPKGKHCGKDCHKATDSKFYACLDTNLGEVLFHYIMLWDKEKGNFPVRFIASPSVEFPKICLTIKHICALPSAYWKKSLDQIRDGGRKHKTANSKETAFVTPTFWAFKLSAGQFSQIVKILRDFIKTNLRKSKAKTNYCWWGPPFVEP